MFITRQPLAISEFVVMGLEAKISTVFVSNIQFSEKDTGSGYQFKSLFSGDTKTRLEFKKKNTIRPL